MDLERTQLLLVNHDVVGAAVASPLVSHDVAGAVPSPLLSQSIFLDLILVFINSFKSINFFLHESAFSLVSLAGIL